MSAVEHEAIKAQTGLFIDVIRLHATFPRWTDTFNALAAMVLLPMVKTYQCGASARRVDHALLDVTVVRPATDGDGGVSPWPMTRTRDAELTEQIRRLLGEPQG